MTELIQCGHCGTAIEVPEGVLAQGLAAVAEFDAACAEKCRQADALETERNALIRDVRWQKEHLRVTGSPGCMELIAASPAEIEERERQIEEWSARYSTLLDEIVKLEAGMGHQLNSVMRQRYFDKRCTCCGVELQVPDEVFLQGESAMEAFVTACSEDCAKAAEIERQMGATRKEDEELAGLYARMAHVPVRIPAIAGHIHKGVRPEEVSPASASSTPLPGDGIVDRHPVAAIVFTLLFLIALYLLQSGSF